MKKMFFVLIAAFLLTGCAGPVDSVKRMVFEGTTKPIRELLTNHPQVKNVGWKEMPVLGEGVVVARVTFVEKDAEGKTKEKTLLINMKVVKNSGIVMNVEYIPLPEERVLFTVEHPIYDTADFLRRLEAKKNLDFFGSLREYFGSADNSESINTQDSSLENEDKAKEMTKTIATALEVYASEHDGKYPSDWHDLEDYVQDVDSYINKTVEGYYYSLELNPITYTLTASPKACGTTGNKVFMINTERVNTGADLLEKQCK